MPYKNFRSKQRGVALFVSLIMLLLMSIIVVQAARSSSLEILLGINSEHAAQALMLAEDSALTAEITIELNYPGAPAVDFNEKNDEGFYVAGDLEMDTMDWTSLQAMRIGSGADHREYIVEYLGPAIAQGGSLSVGAGVASDKRFLYRVSGRGQFSRGTARVIQTIFATAE